MRASSDRPKPRPVRGFVVSGAALAVFKWTVYALLAANVVLYGLHGTLIEQVDTGAWVVLLLLFEWETGGWRFAPMARRAAHGLRLVASLAVLASWAGYALEREWLDFANATAWLAVVVSLELDVRVPRARRRFHEARRMLTFGLYLALAGFVVAWFLIGIGEDSVGAWLDTSDATLWLLAFMAIELNVFGWERRAARGAAG